MANDFVKKIYRNNKKDGSTAFPTSVEAGSLSSNNPWVSGRVVNWGSVRGTANSPVDRATRSSDIYVEVGQDIQTAIDVQAARSGGKVLLKNGIHKPKKNIYLYGGVLIEGESYNAIVDFESQAFGFIAQGTNSYTTGTISVNLGGTTVTGAGTAWTDDMIGRDILLKGVWYPIVARTNGTELTIAYPFVDTNVAGIEYAIADVMRNAYIYTLTIRNSFSYAIYIAYCSDFYVQNVIVETCAYCLYDSFSYNSQYEALDALYCAYGQYFYNSNYFFHSLCGATGTTIGNGINMENCSYFNLFTDFILASSNDGGIKAVNCDTGTYKACVSNNNLFNGISLFSNNRNIVIEGTSTVSNGANGIYLGANNDYNIISNNLCRDNGDYGIDISAATCDGNLIGANIYNNNVTGDYDDNGTNTKIVTVV